MLVDTHCHLGDTQFDADRGAVVERARAVGVGHVIIVADSAVSSERALELATQYRLSATAGVHPHEASSWSLDTSHRVREVLQHPAVVAVGETGLDYHYDHSPRPVQRQAFLDHLSLGTQIEKPVVVHVRDADEDAAAMLRDLGRTALKVVLHSFSSGTAVFEAGLEVGAYFSFSGMVTFKSWTLHDIVRECPRNRLLIETDAPYLSPVPHRGKRNEPAYVSHVAGRLAELLETTVEAVATQTTANAGACFGARVAQPIEEPS